MSKKDKGNDAHALAKMICKDSIFYSTSTNAGYMDYAPLAHQGTLPLDKATIATIILSITESPCPAPLRDTVFFLVSHCAEKVAKAQDVYIRIGFADGTIFLKMGTKGVVKITATGISRLKSSPIPFRNGRYMRDMPIPKFGNDDSPMPGIKKLLKLLPVSKKDKKLIVAWLLAAFMRTGTLPILLLEGPEASTLSTVMKILMKLVDWNEPSVIAGLPGSEKELLAAAFNRCIIGFDNVTNIKHGADDWLCRISEGVAVSSSKVQTGGDERVIHIKSLIALSGVSTGAAGCDILDRALRVEVPMLSGENRRSEAEVEEEFKRSHPVILDSLLQVVQHGLKSRATLPPKLRNGRLPDFAEWVYRCVPALKVSPEKLVQGILTNQKKVKLEVLSTDSVAEVLFSLLDSCTDSTWVGRSTELFEAFSKTADAKGIKPGARPTSPRALTSWLDKAESSLYAAGVTIKRVSTSKGGRLTIKRK